MQFLVYLAVLMVAISTVLLEVHWLTSPAPQPKPTVQASAPPPAKVEGPNAALSPIYPKKLDASPQSAESNSQAQSAPVSTPQTSQAAPAQQSAPAASAAQAVPTQPPAQQQPAPAASAVQAAPTQPPAQTTQPALAQQPAAAPQPQKKNSAETTGSAVREGNTRQMTADPPNAANRADNSQQTVQGSSSNRCDVQACASAYRSFRVSDCTYQPFDGVRRLCEKSPGQRMAREREQPERRRWSGDAEARYLDRPTSGRRFVGEDDDVAADFDDARREPLGFFLFGRRPRW
jgi:hypothetical protein